MGFALFCSGFAVEHVDETVGGISRELDYIVNCVKGGSGDVRMDTN